MRKSPAEQRQGFLCQKTVWTASAPEGFILEKETLEIIPPGGLQSAVDSGIIHL